MNTPICDFVKKYAASGATRLHMPGHKGKNFIGIESLDLTEIDGADDLYHPRGIILESEANASRLYGARTFYSTEGSSLCIRAMVYLAIKRARKNNRKPFILAGRNAHKSFLYACALVGADIKWIFSDNQTYHACKVGAEKLNDVLSALNEKPCAVYITSPDYLGNTADIKGLSEVCRKHGVLLLVDNAHGAYLKFLEKSLHPIDLGADMCASSAHKTLPCLTGGAYLQLSEAASVAFASQAKNAMSAFGSTSPSYLVLEALDNLNAYLANGYAEALKKTIFRIDRLKSKLSEVGFRICGDEPLKLTLSPKEYGYTGKEIDAYLQKNSIVCEFCDEDFIVFMFTPETEKETFDKLENLLVSLPLREKITRIPPSPGIPEKTLSVKDAFLSDSEVIPVKEAKGRILSTVSLSCPPAIPIAVSGEVIDEKILRCFEYYEIAECEVVKQIL